jgi:uncharacterized protein YhfF
MPQHESVKKMWLAYHASLGIEAPAEPIADHFCDNENDANELAALVRDGVKRATAGALWSYEKAGQALPAVGGIFIVTNWAGVAICVVKSTKVSIIPFNEITEEHAQREGEGDKSLAYWRRGHLAFFENEFKRLGLTFSESMPIVFEEFERVFP